MFCKFKNIFCLTALALILGLPQTARVQAQGLVTLADDATQEDPTLKDIPDEISLFGDIEETDQPQKQERQAPVKEAVPSASQNPPSGLANPSVNDYAPVQAEPQDNSGGIFAPLPTNNPLVVPTGAGVGAFGSREFTEIDDTVFSTMSDIEKQTALLDLELRKEKVKNEIEAIKNQRKQALEEEKEKQEAKKRQKVEWEKAQEQKVIQEQQKLRELDISFEKVRQEKLLNSYKNKMLEENQSWISVNSGLYDQINGLKKEKQEILDEAKSKLSSLKTALQSAAAQANESRLHYQRQIADLQTQISILKARIEAQEQELIEKQNPFAEGQEDGMANGTTAASLLPDEMPAPELKLSNMYAVMEIRGQGGELIAKLINQDGEPFYVKKGTSLQSGHIIDDITSTYVRADKNGTKDYLYFAAGGILPLEPKKSDITMKDGGTGEEGSPAQGKEARTFLSSDGVPGMGKDMIAR